MKRLTGIISILTLTSIISACSSETITNVQPAAQNQQVVAQSAQGLKTFYSKVVDRIFVLLDKDKNKSVSLEEFMTRTNETSFANPSQPNTNQPATTNQAPVTFDKNLFTQIDKNKNGKLSLTEARNNSRLFLGMTKTQLRTLVGKTMFGSYDKNNDKYVSKQEFLGDALANSDVKTSTLLTSLFYNSDKNSDNKLSFSEFEDFAYSMIKSLWDNPAPPPAPPSPEPPANPPADNNPAPPAEQPAPPSEQPAPPAGEPTQPAEPTAPTDVQ
ncbi:MAG: EF-hand domain-containing protein [Candidatus Sericytochromatia bacterium]